MSPASLFDFELDVRLRAFIGLWLMPQIAFRAVRELNLVPRLYADFAYNDFCYVRIPVRIVAAFDDGTIGVSTEDEEFGKYTRVSPYSVTNLREQL